MTQVELHGWFCPGEMRLVAPVDHEPDLFRRLVQVLAEQPAQQLVRTDVPIAIAVDEVALRALEFFGRESLLVRAAERVVTEPHVHFVRREGWGFTQVGQAHETRGRGESEGDYGAK
jgi:hypothetical protein